MIEINDWISGFLNALEETFGERVWFAGLQGSYGRGEATEASDIDLVVILDRMDASDIRTYRHMIAALADRELICGFLAGKGELLDWDASDLFQFYYDTKPLKGSLDELLECIDGPSIDRAVKLGACNIYHGCVHNMLYDRSEEILRGLYKSASFVAQAVYFKQTGKYITRQRELPGRLSAEDGEIIRTFLDLKSGGAVRFEEMSDRLFEWAQKRIHGIEG